MQSRSHAFKSAAEAALSDAQLQASLRGLDSKFVAERARAVAELPGFEALRDAGAEITDHSLSHLDLYLERFQEEVAAAGGQLHFAEDAAQARETVVGLCRAAGAGSVVKSKSMIGEEAGINAALEAAGMSPVETDTGEYILQLAEEPPSHIVAPAYHKRREEVAALFRAKHGGARERGSGEQLVGEAREVLRRRYFDAEVGLTGANFLVAETGQCVLVTNEGNADLCARLPKRHIVLASIDKLVPTLEDTSLLLRLLARSATGQATTMYTTFAAGPRRSGEQDGPEAFHVVLLDNGRSRMLADERLRPALRCIRCGACMNHCPVYASVGGHAYGWVYPGPIGAAINPALNGQTESKHLPQASTLCGACEAVCPVKIPLPMMFRYWREQAHAQRISPARERWGVRLWARLAAHPRLYRLALRLARTALTLWARGGAARWIPFAGGWTRRRDMPAPAPGRGPRFAGRRR